jgi:hypothetical protein
MAMLSLKGRKHLSEANVPPVSPKVKNCSPDDDPPILSSSEETFITDRHYK